MTLRRGPNVAIPVGAVYPDGLRVTPPNANVQATVRPAGGFFLKSPGFETIRPGKWRLQANNHGLGIHFTPQRFAEDVGEYDTLPLVVDEQTSAEHVDVADLPGSERLDDKGALTADAINRNEGVKMGESTAMAPTGGSVMHAGTKSAPDMGDREPGRPLTRDFWGLVRNPTGVFRDEYAENPLMAVGAAGVIVGLVYYAARELERNYRSRESQASSGGGVTATVAPVAAVPAAAADTAGGAVRDAAAVANTAATEAGKAAEQAASAAGDVAEEAGKAAEKVTDAASDTVTK